VCLLFLWFLCSVFAHSPKQRTLKVKVDHDKLSIEAKYKNDTYEDEFQVEADLGTGKELVDFKFDYEKVNLKNTTDLELDFEIHGIVEFIVTDDQPIFTNESEVVYTWPGDDKIKWTDWNDNSGVQDGVYIYNYSATAGPLLIRVLLAATNATVGGLAIDPNSVKIDVEVRNFPYSRPNKTRLALVTEVKSKTTSSVPGSKAIKDNKLIFSDQPDLPLGTFSWYDKVQADGSDIDIVAWTSTTGKHKTFDIYFTYLTDVDVRPDSLLWDPRVGLDYQEVYNPPFCLGTLCGGGAIALICVILGGVVIAAVLTLTHYAYKKRASYEKL